MIEGSVQRAGEKVKISARLSKAADGFQVWTDSFLRDAKDVFAVEEEIAGLIANQLSLKLGVSSAAATASVNPQAFELYVQARQAWDLRTAPAVDRAEEMLNRAIALEPNFARARAALADVWLARGAQTGVIGTFEQRGSAELARIAKKVRQALALDPDAAETHATLGLVHWYGWDFAEDERELRRAIALNPNYAPAHQWLGRVLETEGQFDESLAQLKLSTEIDPLSAINASNYGATLSHAGCFSEAIQVIDRALALQPGFPQLLSRKAEALLDVGRMEEAVALVRQMEDGDLNDRLARIRMLTATGSKDGARALLADSPAQIHGP